MLVTGIGSLPHLDAWAAVEFVAEHSPSIPFWPQLPNRSPRERMIEQTLAEPAEESMAGFFAFERALERGMFPAARMLKGQVTGPVTMAWHSKAHADSFVRLAADRAVWQVERLRRFGLAVMLMVDEPCLAGDAGPVREVIAEIRAAGAVAGVHCCAANPFPALAECGADAISFDAELCSPSRAEGLLEFPGALALGIDGHTLPAAFARREFAGRALITATCGLALRGEAGARASFENSARLAAELRGLL